MRLFTYQIVQQDSKAYWFDLSRHPSMDAIKQLEYLQLIDMCQKSFNLIYAQINKKRELKRKKPIIINVLDAVIKGDELKVTIEGCFG